MTSKPKLSATFDGKGQVLLEWTYNANDKQFAVFDTLIFQAKGVWRKRKGAKHFGRLIPWPKYQEIESQLIALFNIAFGTDFKLELEVVDVIDEICDSWPGEEIYERDLDPEWMEDENGD